MATVLGGAHGCGDRGLAAARATTVRLDEVKRRGAASARIPPGPPYRRVLAGPCASWLQSDSQVVLTDEADASASLASVIAGMLARSTNSTPMLASSAGPAPAARPSVGSHIYRAIARSFNAIVPEPLRFLWHPYILRGAITILQGEPGVGKSSLATDVGARVTTGATAPLSDAAMPTGDVLFISAEDSASSVMAHALKVAGANLDRAHLMTNVLSVREGVPRPLDLARHIEAIEEFCRERRVILIVVDPVFDFLGSDVNVYSDHAMRQVLAPLRAFAQRLDLAVLLIRHLTKTGSGTAVNRGAGSTAFGGVARSVLEVEPSGDAFVLSSGKRNNTRKPPRLRYRIVEIQVSADVAIGKVEWLATVQEQAAQLAPPTKREAAVAFLLQRLAGGPVPVATLEQEADALGIKWRTVEDAKKEAGVEANRVGHGWSWSLPIQDRKAAAPLGEPDVAVLSVPTLGPEPAAETALAAEVDDPSDQDSGDGDLDGAEDDQ